MNGRTTDSGFLNYPNNETDGHCLPEVQSAINLDATVVFHGVVYKAVESAYRM